MALLLTSILISLLAALWVWMAGRKDPRGRPWLTGLCMGMLLVLPLMTLLPKFHWELVAVGDSLAQSLHRDGSQWGVVAWLLVAWSVGAGLMAVRLIRRQRLLVRWVADSAPADCREWKSCMAQCVSMLGMKSLPALRVKMDLNSPVVTGLFKPVVLFPPSAQQWPEETVKMAVLHELGHIQRKDLWLRLTADITCAMHWYNPLVWWMKSRLLTQCEYACDARVIASGANPKTYIHALCDVVESAYRATPSPCPAGVCAMADHAPLRMRVNRLLQGHRVRSPWLAVVAAVITIATSLGMTMVRPALKNQAGSSVPSSPGLQYSQEEIDLRHSANPFPEH
ncbi:MAG: M56 family metallopeptidase [Akkermansiaceae bacterium]|nr:M56 family metallopeptidase [Akkermansiaceae bacterium]